MIQEKKYFKKCLEIFSSRQGTESVFYDFVLTIYKKEIKLEAGLLKYLNSAPDYVKFFLFPKIFNYNDFKPDWLLEYDPSSDGHSDIYEKLGKIEEIKNALEQELKKEYHPKYSEMYTRYFL